MFPSILNPNLEDIIYMLKDYLKISNIRIGINVSNWKDLVKQVGSILVVSNDIEPRYVEAMIDVIEDLGPYSVISPGVVLLHARPEDGVNNICIAMATLQESINFGSVNDPVKLAIALGAIDHHSHIELLRDLAHFLENKENVNSLISSSNRQEFYRIILNNLTKT